MLFKSWSSTQPAKAKTVLTHGVDALKTSFLSSYVSETGKLPVEFNITDQSNSTIRRKTKGGFEDVPSTRKNRFTPNVVVGEGISKESAGILSNMLAVFTNNPKYAKEVANEIGAIDATPQQLVKMVVLGLQLTEDDVAFQGQQARDKVEATASKGALKLQPFIDKGFTKQEMLDTLDSLGFADNATKENTISQIEEAFE